MRRALLIATSVLFFGGVVLAATPATILYQGVLRESGQPINGAKTMKFRITNSDGSQEFFTTGNVQVTFSQGSFSHSLDVSGLDLDTIPAGGYYVETTIDGQLLLPRDKLVSSLFSVRAKSVDDDSITLNKLSPGLRSQWGNFVSGNSDDLGNHVATTTLNMSGYDIANAGKITVSSFTLTTGASNGYLLQSDASGKAGWVAPTFGSGDMLRSVDGAAIAASTSTLVRKSGDTMTGTLSITNGVRGGVIISTWGIATEGGELRGPECVDLQYYRTNDAQVAHGMNSAILGGWRNQIGASGDIVSGEISAIIAGSDNLVSGGGYSVILGGGNNTMSGVGCAIAGGAYNRSSGSQSAVVGGWENSATGNYSIVCGGERNLSAYDCAAILGGYGNYAGAFYATILGGRENTAFSNYSYAAGYKSSATAEGAWALSDATGTGMTVSSANVFGAYFSGGYWMTGGNFGIGTTDPQTKFYVEGGTSTFTGQMAVPNMDEGSGTAVNIAGGFLVKATSSRRYKEDIQPLKTDFSRALDLQPVRFVYRKTKTPDIGYIAEDVDALGMKDLVIYDKEGRPDALKYDRIPVYTLEIVKQQQKEIADLKARNNELEERLRALEAKVK